VSLLKKIHAKAEQDGFITFDQYMDLCLYYPNHRYYNNKNISFEKNKSDFITAPELSSVYAESIIEFYLNCKKFKNINNIVEFGAGSGELACNFLKNIDGNFIPKKYFIIEKSLHLRKQQKEKINKILKDERNVVEWIDDIAKINDVFIIANEVFDAIPSKIFIKDNNNFYERVIKIKNNTLYFSKIACNKNVKNLIQKIEERINMKFPNNYMIEINFQYEKFLEDIFNGVNNFIFFIADYGYGEKELFHKDRNSGTLQFYKNHEKIKNCFNNPGSFDISISVDFSNLARIVKKHNIALLSYTTQTEFLINTKIVENSIKYSKDIDEINALKTLLFPTDMGENFKIMLLCDNMNSEFNIPFKDYRHKL